MLGTRGKTLTLSVENTSGGSVMCEVWMGGGCGWKIAVEGEGKMG